MSSLLHRTCLCFGPAQAIRGQSSITLAWATACWDLRGIWMKIAKDEKWFQFMSVQEWAERVSMFLKVVSGLHRM